ncbi:MAG: aminopeptidase P family protein, partial [Phycisphaerales bacterium]|nr:aminopeptidase P family protein [Phycisphaerales bacterium]
GITDEPGAALLLDQSNPVATRRAMLFLRPLNPEVEKWDGYRETIGAALRAACGIEAVFRTNLLPRMLGEAVKRSKRVACLHPLAAYTAPVSSDLDVFQKLAQRVPGLSIEDRSELLPQLRSVKSAAELEMIRRAISITAVGFAEAMRTVRPGLNEFDVQETIEHAYRSNGARALAFRTIAGAGFNSTVLHYHANDQELRDGDLVCIDSGARFGGYAADITRTVPVSGTFTPRQREVYEIVLKAMKAAIAAAKEGVRNSDIDKAARDVIKRAGYGDYFIHGIGHHLGLETHDANPDMPLKAGSVMTIEPGIYIPEERIGIRIEDDIVIGRRGATVLSEAIPREADDIERAMAGAGSTPGPGSAAKPVRKPAPKRKRKA